ncbi:cation:proton antiporter [Azospirillum sp.]|uniref:cation:proton antiporter n=1 Tax=Azospirillum sp. TaxID=34012 RepID=UPI002D265E01|nr:cation:proton antiporter [Azospirillum sp.]HYD67072.1 cation:proton antiporter [Azospirillum sp.]
MDPYIAVLTGVGLLILLVAWLPMLLREMPLSLPIVCVGIGFLVFRFLAPAGGEPPHPLRFPELTERLTELVVIVSLMGCGLKLDRPIGLRAWRVTWRLLAVTMPLCIIALAVMGWAMAGLGVAAAVLLAASLAPTDPVLAADVQVGPPQSGEEDEVRFGLTSEAGLNDGLAFPFTNLAIALALHGAAVGEWTWEWLGYDVAWKLGAGLAAGWGIGAVLGWLTFHLPNRAKLSKTGDGFLALGMTFLAYGLTEMVHGYGFIAVFVAAVAFRHAERNHRFHERLHDFAEQMERLLMMVVLVLFGGALAHGLLDALTWPAAVCGLLFLIVVRPLATWVGLLGTGRPLEEVMALGFFGIRGVGTLYYLAYALGEAEWAQAELVWAMAGFVVLVSVLVHGTTVTPALRRLDGRRGSASPAAREMAE